MYFRCLSSLLLCTAGAMLAASPPVLRVCADPNNMPFSNQQGQGFENKLAEMLAAQLGTKLEYSWWAERKSFLKNSLEAGRCDLVMGVPTALTSVATTRAYYQSTYVFVSRHDRNLHVTSLSDPRFAGWHVGVHVVGENYAPPAAALAHRGITTNVIGFSLFGRYGEINPARKLIDAVVNNQIDVAIVWGPFAGYFAKQESAAVDLVPVSPSTFLAIPFTYEIAAGVRKSDSALRRRLDTAIANDSAEIQRILDRYGVPQVRGE